MKKGFIYLLLIMSLLFIPTIVKADTWLDDPSYYDISWFRSNTYNTDINYSVKTPAEIAGLAYLVNVEGYDFEGKNIYLGRTELNGVSYVLNSPHEWVPINSNFKGIIIYRNLLHYRVNEEETLLINSSTVKIRKMINTSNTPGDIEEVNPKELLVYFYKPEVILNEHGIFTSKDEYIGQGHYNTFWVRPDVGYDVDKVEIFDKDNNPVSYLKTDKYEYKFVAPKSKSYFKITYKKIENQPWYIVNGNGKNIGDELSCGDEHFYVLSNDGTNIRLISKYNLNVGNTINKEKIERNGNNPATDYQICSSMASYRNGEALSDEYYNTPGYCYISVPTRFVEKNSISFEYTGSINAAAEDECKDYLDKLNDDEYEYILNKNGGSYLGRNVNCSYTKIKRIKQDENAIGAHWDENDEYLYPQVADVYIDGQRRGGADTDPTNYRDFIFDEESGSKYDNYFYDLKIGNGPISEYLSDYATNLGRKGFVIQNIDLLTLDDINTIVKKNNKSINYEDWHNHTGSNFIKHFEFGSLKDYLTEKQSFLYSTTYWVRNGYDKSFTGEYNQVQHMSGVNNIVFVDSAGGVCGSGVTNKTVTDNATCSYYYKIVSQLGAGIRPVITMSINDVKFIIRTKTDGNGELEAQETASGNDSITFRVITKDNYTLDTLTVVSDSGESITFTENDITYNDDGTISIETNNFTMPFDNVTIEAKWKKESGEPIINPQTFDSIISYIILFVISISGLSIMYKIKKRG